MGFGRDWAGFSDQAVLQQATAGAFVQLFTNSFVWMFRRFIDGICSGCGSS